MKSNTSKVTDFRPISLSTVLHKIGSKIIASRLRPILPLLISPEQGAFVVGRSISDNILMATEVQHTALLAKCSHVVILMKVDMSKAFDRISWKFLMVA